MYFHLNWKPSSVLGAFGINSKTHTTALRFAPQLPEFTITKGDLQASRLGMGFADEPKADHPPARKYS
jgi:hypothetical protein